MKVFNVSRQKTVPAGWLHPSLCGEVFRNVRNGRARQDRYPDSSFRPHPAFPMLSSVALGFVADTVAQPSRNLTGFPAPCRIVGGLIPPVQRTAYISTPISGFAKEKIRHCLAALISSHIEGSRCKRSGCKAEAVCPAGWIAATPEALGCDG